jgi:hypothetical protein
MKRYFEAQAGYLLGKAVLWRGYTGNFSNRLWRVADLPDFAFDAFR